MIIGIILIRVKRQSLVIQGQMGKINFRLESRVNGSNNSNSFRYNNRDLALTTTRITYGHWSTKQYKSAKGVSPCQGHLRAREDYMVYEVPRCHLEEGRH
jgi:hypothetical protein